MKYIESWIKNTALDYDMDIEEVQRRIDCCGPDDDIYEDLENFIANRAYASENGLWGY